MLGRTALVDAAIAHSELSTSSKRKSNRVARCASVANMTTRNSPRRKKNSDVDRVEPAEHVKLDDWLGWLPTYVPLRCVADNVFSLARPLLGKAFAEWSWCLAREVAARFPEANDSDQGPGWAAGVLWAATMEAGVLPSNDLWDRILADITKMTGVSRATAEQHWEMLKRVGLEVPASPPAYWL